MNRIKAFSERNIKEILRDPLSYIFCLGFPLVMLVIMTLVNESIPAETGMTIFRIDNLYGGVAVFGQTFTMLFTAINVSKDRSCAFLVRLYATPMKTIDFIGGYIFPAMILSVMQNIIIAVSSLIISLITGVEINTAGLILSIIVLIPSAVLFIGFGLLAGMIFSDKSAPAMSSIIISLGSFLGGIWFDAKSTGGVMLKICKCLPFYYCTESVRTTTAMNTDIFSVFIVIICAIVITTLSVVVFRTKMKADLS